MRLLRAIFRLREIRKILTECEWAASTGHSDYGLDASCPYCYGVRGAEEGVRLDFYAFGVGHDDNCPLGRMLDLIGREDDERCDQDPDKFGGMKLELYSAQPQLGNSQVTP